MAKSRDKQSSGSVQFLRRGDALLIIDCINDLEFPGGEKVFPWALKLASRLKRVRSHVRRLDLPVIYVNDNFGKWRSSFSEVYTFCTRAGARGRESTRKLKPGAHDYFVLKPRHSGFL